MDVEDWMAYVPDNERRALWAYRDAIEKFVKQGNYEASFSFNVRDLEVDQKSLSGGGKALTVSSARGTAKGGADEDKTDWRYDGRCVHSDSSNKFCADHRFEAIDSLYYPLLGAFGVMGDGGTVVATKDHGGWVVSPLASIARTLKSQFSNASTEELYAWIGVPMFAPATGQLTLGQRKSGTFNKGGYAVFDVSLDKGTQYVYERDATTRADQDCEQFGFDSSGGCSGYINDQFFGPSADAIPYLDIGATGDDATEAFTVDHSGENRLVIFGKPGGHYSILFGVVPQRAWPSGTNNASGTLTRDEPAVAYKFQLGEGAQTGSWQIGEQNGDASIQVFTSDGAQVTSEGNGYELEQGVTYLLVVSGQVGTTYDVALEQGGATIDGQTSIDGSLDEGYERSYDLSVVGSSSTTIDLSIDDPSADLDLYFTATGGSCSDDQSAGYDSIESITVDGPCAGTLKVLARNDSSYTLSVEQ
jgi:hypothetical protein